MQESFARVGQTLTSFFSFSFLLMSFFVADGRKDSNTTINERFAGVPMLARH